MKRNTAQISKEERICSKYKYIKKKCARRDLRPVLASFFVHGDPSIKAAIDESTSTGERNAPKTVSTSSPHA